MEKKRRPGRPKKASRSVQVSMRIPADLDAAIEACREALSQHSLWGAVQWHRTTLLTWLAWRGLAGAKKEIESGEWTSRRNEAGEEWSA